jgi:hypothetical protein
MISPEFAAGIRRAMRKAAAVQAEQARSEFSRRDRARRVGPSTGSILCPGGQKDETRDE